MLVRFVLAAVATAISLFGQASASPVVVNEILYMPDAESADAARTHQWVELANVSTEAVDLAGYKIAGREGRDGGSARALPSVVLPAGGYLVIHFATGENQLDFSSGGGHFYTGDDAAAGVWNWAMDEAALYSSERIVDFVAWYNTGTPFRAGAAHDEAVAAGIWSAGAALNSHGFAFGPAEFLRMVQTGQSVGRDYQSTDTNQLSDFEAHGGAQAMDMSPGRRNADPLPITIVPEADPAPEKGGGVRAADGANPKKWTVMVYMALDNSLAQFAGPELVEMARGGGSGKDVNVVVYLDTYGPVDASGVPVSLAQRGLVKGIRSDGNLEIEVAKGEENGLGKRDTGDPSELKDFLAWAKGRYPAERYALIIESHGQGWKGVSQDERAGGRRQGFDILYMNELSAALAGQNLDLLAFYACLMSGLEVATQVQPFAKYMLASEELVNVLTLPFGEMVQTLNANPAQDGKTLGSFLVDAFKTRNDGGFVMPDRTFFKPTQWTAALTDLGQVGPLNAAVDALAGQLYTGVGLLAGKDIAADNVQEAIRKSSTASTRFGDDNFVDLDDLTRQVQANPGIPPCAKSAAGDVLKALEEKAVVKEAHGSSLPRVRGLHIHFPVYRSFAPPKKRVFGLEAPVEPYDSPMTRLTDGSSRLAAYAENPGSMPYKARDEEDPDTALAAPKEWPRTATPQFTFVTAVKQWPRFLDRFYHPTADAHIVSGKGPNGTAYVPKVVPGGACENAMESIVVPLGAEVSLSGAGSSDGDMPNGLMQPTYYFWDLDSDLPCTGNCIAPSAVPAGSNAAAASTDNKDEELMPANSTIDDQDASGPFAKYTCSKPGSHGVTLQVWDDNHTFAFHDTNPSASYVHPQLDFNQVLIICEAPGTFEVEEPPLYYNLYTVPLGVNVKNPDGSPAAGKTVTVESVGPVTVTKQGAAGPRQATIETVTDKFGRAIFTIMPSSAGPGEVRVSIPDAPVRRVQFNTLIPADPPGVGLQVTPPTSLTVNTPATIAARVLEQSGPVSMVSFLAISSNVRFNDNRQFAGNKGTQVFTGSGGDARVSITATAGGPVEILATTGNVVRRISIPVTGGTPLPDSLVLSGAPAQLAFGATGTITATVRAGTEAPANVPVTFQVTQGKLNLIGAPANATQFTVNTTAAGTAALRFTAIDSLPVTLTATVGGTALKQTVYFTVGPPPR